MPVVFSALIPHSPVLLPEIGKQNIEKLSKTVHALREIEADVYAAKAEVLLIISSHSPQSPDRFYINLYPRYILDFSPFGYVGDDHSFLADQEFILHLKSRLDQSGIAVQLISEQKLDYGAGVPLIYLTQHLPQVFIVPLSISGLDLQSHFAYGQEIQREIQKSNKRIAVIVSGDLAHHEKDEASAQKFDDLFLEFFQGKKLSSLTDFPLSRLGQASECILKPALILAGILDGINSKTRVLSYESSLGVGMAVVSFEFS